MNDFTYTNNSREIYGLDSSSSYSSSSGQSSSSDFVSSDFSDVTKSSESMESSSFGGEQDLFRQAMKVILKIDNPSVVNQAESLLSTIRKTIRAFEQEKPEISEMPPLHASAEEDGSLIIEWIFPEFRIGFNIEPSPDDSGWHLIASKKLGDIAISRQLTDMRYTINLLFNFILSSI